jgi:hypothetical protein
LKVANPQSFNRYAYVHNDPVNFKDPSGLIQVCGNPGYSACPSDDPGTSPIGGAGNPLGGDDPNNPTKIVDSPTDTTTGGGIDPQNTRRRMTEAEISNLRSQLDTFLTGKCKDLVEGTMKAMKGGVWSTNLLTLFNKLAESGALISNPTLEGKGGLGGGNVPDGTAEVIINFNYAFTSPVWTAIEELTHANGPTGATSIGHDLMAQAAIDAARSLGISLDGLKNTNTPLAEVQNKSTDVGDKYNSTLFRNVLSQACK